MSHRCPSPPYRNTRLSQDPWAALAGEFQSLGGTAENVRCQPCEQGVGLFVTDPSKPACVSVPQQLLVPTEQVALVDGCPCLIDTDKQPEHYINWFNAYQRRLGYTEPKRTRIDRFERGLAALPLQTLSILESMGLLNLELRHRGSWQDVVFRQYLHSRSFLYRGRRVLMPMVDLINHSPTAQPYLTSSGVQVSGAFDEEVLVRYNETDPLGRFFNHGFASAEPIAFSYPASLPLDRHQRRQQIAGLVSAQIERLPDPVPLANDLGKHQRIEVVTLEHLPNLPPQPLDHGDLADFYDDAFWLNQVQLMALSDSLKGCHGDCARALKAAIGYQQQALCRLVRVFAHG